MDQFGLSLEQITSLRMWTLCYFLYGVMALPAGFLADKWSYKAVLTTFFIGTPAAACVIGLAQSALGLSIGMALLGVFASLYHPSGLAMISHGVRERGEALGLQGMAGNLGLAFSPVIVGFLASSLSWRYAFYLLSLPSFITVIIFLLMSRRIEEKEHTGNTVKNSPNAPAQRLTLAAIILLYVAMAVAGFCYQGATTMLPTYLDSKMIFSVKPEFQSNLDNSTIPEGLRQEFDNNGISLSQNAAVSIKKAGSRWQVTDGSRSYIVWKEADKLKIYMSTGRGKMFTTMIFLVGMLGQYMGGYLSDKRRKTLLYLIFNAVSMPFMILIGLATSTLIVIAAALFALFHFAGQPVENNLIAQYIPPRLRSSGYGLKFVFTFGLGSFGSRFVGYVGERFGLNSVFIALGGVIFMIVILTSLLSLAAKESRRILKEA